MDTNTRDNNIQEEKARIIPKGSFIFCLLVGIIGLGIATFCHIGVANGKRTHLKTNARLMAGIMCLIRFFPISIS